MQQLQVRPAISVGTKLKRLAWESKVPSRIGEQNYQIGKYVEYIQYQLQNQPVVFRLSEKRVPSTYVGVGW